MIYPATGWCVLLDAVPATGHFIPPTPTFNPHSLNYHE